MTTPCAICGFDGDATCSRCSALRAGLKHRELVEGIERARDKILALSETITQLRGAVAYLARTLSTRDSEIVTLLARIEDLECEAEALAALRTYATRKGRA